MTTTTATVYQSPFKKKLLFLQSAFKNFLKNDKYIIFSFLIPAALLFVSYMAFTIFPVGDESVLALDLNGQYVYYYDYMYDVLAGKESIFYSWSRNLSGEFMGIIGYYLGSPFNFIVWAFPREMITEGLMVMMLVKVGAIGTCTAIFLGKGRKISSFTTIIFSSMYALCSYVMVQTMNPMWLDGVMILPLVIMGIEALIHRGKFIMLIASLSYAFITCFYIGYMIGIFAAVYFIYYMVKSNVGGSNQRVAAFFRKGLAFAGSALVAVAIAAFMILPVYYSLSNGKFEFSNPNYSAVANFTMMDLFVKMLPNSYDTVRMTGLPFLYAGLLTLIMLPIYFICSKIPRRERISSAFLLFFMAVCMYIRPVDMMWHGGQMPNWLPYRYSFIISFLIIVFGATAFENLKSIKNKTIGIVCGIMVFMTLFAEKFPAFEPAKNGEKGQLIDLVVILPAILIIGILATILVNKDKMKSLNFKNAILVIVMMEISFNTIMAVVRQDNDIVYSNRSSYLGPILPTREVVREIKENDPGFYRIEKNYFRTTNDPMATGMYGLSHSSSTLNAKPIELLKNLGFTARSHYTRYSGNTPITSDVFGVKYILNTEKNETKDIENKDSITVTKNEDAHPIAYLVGGNTKKLMFSANDPFYNQNMMYSYMAGFDENQEYFTKFTEDEIIPENVSKSTSNGHTLWTIISKGKNAQVQFVLTAPKNGEVFMYLPTSYERKTNLWVNGEWAGNYFESDNHHIKSLGTFNQGDKIKVVLTLTKDNMYYKEAQFASFDAEKAKDSNDKIAELNKDTVVEKLSSTHIKISLKADAPTTLLTTIPEEKGWTLYLNGKEENYKPIMDKTLISFDVPAGFHIVELKFTTAGYPFALFITLGGIVVFAGLITVYILVRKKKKAADNEIKGQVDKFLADIMFINDETDEESEELFNENPEQPDALSFDENISNEEDEPFKPEPFKMDENSDEGTDPL